MFLVTDRCRTAAGLPRGQASDRVARLSGDVTARFLCPPLCPGGGRGLTAYFPPILSISLFHFLAPSHYEMI